MYQILEPKQLYYQAQRNWVVRSALTRHSSRIRNLTPSNPAHVEFLQGAWLDSAVMVVYTGYLRLNKKFEPCFGYDLDEGWNFLTWGTPINDQGYYTIEGLVRNYWGMGQTLFQTVCDYESVSRLISSAVKDYGTGMVQYSTANKLSAEERGNIVKTFSENGTAQIVFTDTHTVVKAVEVKYDWQGVQIELDEKRIAIETVLTGSDQRKSSKLRSDSEQQEGQNAEVDKIFNDSVIAAASKLYGIDLSFKISIDTTEELEKFLPYLSETQSKIAVDEQTDLTTSNTTTPDAIPQPPDNRSDLLSKPKLREKFQRDTFSGKETVDPLDSFRS